MKLSGAKRTKRLPTKKLPHGTQLRGPKLFGTVVHRTERSPRCSLVYLDTENLDSVLHDLAVLEWAMGDVRLEAVHKEDFDDVSITLEVRGPAGCARCMGAGKRKRHT